MSSDEKFSTFLTVGPMCRYAKDLPTLVHIMAGSKAYKLRLDETVFTKDIKIHYLEDFGFSVGMVPVDEEIKIAMYRAVQFFKDHGLQTERAEFDDINDCPEMALCSLQSLTDLPNMFNDRENPKESHSLLIELGKAMIGKSQFTLAGVMFYILYKTKHMFSPEDRQRYLEMKDALKKQMIVSYA